MFEHLEARTNVAAMKRLSNATARIDGNDVRVIFDAEYKVGMVGAVGMGASSPQMVIADIDVPAGFIGMEITVDGEPWEVVDRHSPRKKEAGLSTVLLERP